MVKRLGRWGFVLGWMGLIHFFSCQPDLGGPPSSRIEFAARKTCHVLEYGILNIGLFRALSLEGWAFSVVARRAALLGLTYGVLDETHQTFVMGRFGRFRDVFIDAGGGILGLLAMFVWQRKWGGKR